MLETIPLEYLLTFDTVDHNILLEKLDYYGIRGVAKNWFESYLNNQKQFVTLNGSDSSFKPVSTVLPQGSVPGPLLFLAYINNLHKCVKYSKVYHFTDDTNMLQPDNSLKNAAKRMNFESISMAESKQVVPQFYQNRVNHLPLKLKED